VSYQNLFFTVPKTLFNFFRESLEPQYIMDAKLEFKNFQFNYNIFNFGPSSIKELLVEIQIPSIFIQDPQHLVAMINDAEENNSTSSEIFEPESAIIGSDDSEFVEDSGTNLILDETDEYSLEPEEDASSDYNSTKRRRRSLRQDTGLMTMEAETLLKNSENRTVFFDCSKKSVQCFKKFFKLQDLKANEEPLKIKLNISVNLKTVGEFEFQRIHEIFKFMRF
jgi:hypothetical protein